MKRRNQKVLHLVELAMLVALVVVLQGLGASITIGLVPLTFVLIPVVVGAFLLGPIEGAILGFVFGLITVIQTPASPVLMVFFSANPVAYIAIALLKATLAGLGAALIYKALGKLFHGKYIYLQTTIASISAPIINTGIFVLGMFLFFFEENAMLPEMFPEFFPGLIGATDVILVGLVGFNFIGEFLVSLLLAPAVARIVDIVNSKLKIQ